MNQAQTNSAMPKPKVGVSACLLGHKVRFDGGHKRNTFVDDVLGEYFEFSSFCPEMAIGMGAPRQSIRLVGDPAAPLAVGARDDSLEVSGPLREYGVRVASQQQDLCGYIVKSNSPSCGMERVRVYNAKGMPERSGVGLFTRELMRAQPLLPIEEEGRLNDPLLREHFITRVYVFARWRTMQDAGVTKRGLLEFHARHKLVVMAHNPEGYRRLGRMLADLKKTSLAQLADRYISTLMEMLQQKASRPRHRNVLQHLAGYLRRDIDRDDRSELSSVITAYARGELPLVVPITLLQHHFRRNPNPYVAQQVYLDPHPQALMLRNHI